MEIRGHSLCDLPVSALDPPLYLLVEERSATLARLLVVQTEVVHLRPLAHLIMRLSVNQRFVQTANMTLGSGGPSPGPRSPTVPEASRRASR